MRRKYIFVSVHQKPLSGAPVRFDRLVKRFAELKKEIYWITPKRDNFLIYKNINFLVKNNIKISRITKELLFLYVLFHAHLFIKMRKEDTVVITFGESPLLIAILVSFISKSPLSIGIRSNPVKRKKIIINKREGIKKLRSFIIFRRQKIIWKFAYKIAKHLTVQTPKAKSEIIKLFKLKNTSKIDVIENDIQKKFQLNEYRETTEIKSLLFIGNNGKAIKGFDILVSISKELDSILLELETITVVGVSNEEAESLKEELKTTKINVVYHKRSNNIMTCMLNSDLLFVPSREDQFPNVVLEAMGCDLPVVGSNIDGIEYMLRNDFIMFDPHDRKSVLDCLKRVSSVEGYYKAIKIIRERKKDFIFDWENKYKKLIDAI